MKLRLKKVLNTLIGFWIVIFVAIAGLLLFELVRPLLGFGISLGDGLEWVVYPFYIVLVLGIIFILFLVKRRIKS